MFTIFTTVSKHARLLFFLNLNLSYEIYLKFNKIVAERYKKFLQINFVYKKKTNKRKEVNTPLIALCLKNELKKLNKRKGFLFIL